MGLTKPFENTRHVAFEILTPRELDVLACLLENSASKKIAPILGVKIEAVDTHVSNIAQKLELNGRAQIVDCVKKSVYAIDLHKRYIDLVEAFEFKETLKKIKNHVQSHNLSCKIACENVGLKKRIEDDLSNLRIQCFERKKGAPLVLIETQDNYYQVFFNVLKQLLPQPFIEEEINHFKARVGQFESPKPLLTEKRENIQTRYQYKSPLFLFFSLFVICSVIGFYVFQSNHQSVSPEPVRSDFFVATNILERTKLIQTIDTCFHDKDDIKVVALAGIGGSGKTTLARSYARRQKVTIVYEMNAETKETLLNDFGLLAYKLAHTQDDKFELERIKKIEKDTPKEYQEKLIYFVQKKLKQMQNWFLIFDNVNILADIRPFLPADAHTWGRGKILLTTRNSNISSTGFVRNSHVIALGELTADEKFKIFTAIKQESRQARISTEEFLKEIPSFPLDVSSVAYYIKDTKSSYKECLEVLNKKRKTFDPKLVHPRKFDQYDQTRYSIISCIVDQILAVHKDFSGLLLITSTIDSQNMPKALFQKYTNVDTLNQFVQTMYKFSFFSDYEKNKQDLLFIHRSIQELIWLYLMEYKLTKEKQQHVLDDISRAIYQYADAIIEDYDIDKIRSFLPHTQSFSKHIQAINQTRNEITLQLGRIYYYLCHFAEAKPILISILPVLKEQEKDDLFEKTLAYLGAIYRVMGESKKAETNFIRSIASYEITRKTVFPGYPFALMEYGWVLRERGDYKKAKNILEKSIAVHTSIYGDKHPKTADAIFMLSGLYEIMGDTKKAKIYCEQSLEIHQKNYGDAHQITLWDIFRLGAIEKLDGQYKKALKLLERTFNGFEKQQENAHARYWAPLYLGDMYRCMGLYKQSFELLKKANDFSMQYHGENNLVTQWAVFFFGRLYTDQKEYVTAKKLLERSFEMHEQQLGKNHADTVRIKHALSNLYVHFNKDSREFKKAEQLYAECLIWYEKHYGSNGPAYAQLLSDCGYFYILKRDFVKAERVIKQALKILEEKKHDEVYRCYEYLGDLYHAKGQEEWAQGYYLKSLEYLKQHFSRDSVHIVRLKNKIPFLQRCKSFMQSLSVFKARNDL